MSNQGIILEGLQGQRDENKIDSVVVQYYAVGHDQLYQVGKDDYRGLKESSRSWQAFNGGADDQYIVSVTYKGYSDDAEEPEESDTEVWNVDFDFSEEPILSHPKIKEIRARYGGFMQDDELKFPETMPAASKGKGLGGKNIKSGDKNPMYGVATYAVMTARVTRSWSSRKIPRNAINDIGKVYKEIPAAPDGIASLDFGSREWMAMPPKISQNGDVWRIENEWLLSPPNGWVEEVYERASKQ